MQHYRKREEEELGAEALEELFTFVCAAFLEVTSNGRLVIPLPHFIGGYNIC